MDKCQLSGDSFHSHLNTAYGGEKSNPVSFSLFLTAKAPICCGINLYLDLNAPSKIKSVVIHRPAQPGRPIETWGGSRQ